MSKICLVIVFNHRFDKNIEKIKQLYKYRFSNIFFLMPFYDGSDSSVIPVYECSYQFQGYFAQGLNSFYDESFDDYVFLGDDLILNPQINENNILNYLNIKQGQGYTKSLTNLSDCVGDWPWFRVKDTINSFINPGTSYKDELPSKKLALDLMNKHGFFHFELGSMLKIKLRWFKRYNILKCVCLRKKRELAYPLLYGYSDFIVVAKESIKEFCRICGCFAAMRLFVEVAVPTALVLTHNKVVTEKDSNVKGVPMWTSTEIKLLAEKNMYKICSLYDNWEENVIYYHPIKLSKWEL